MNNMPSLYVWNHSMTIQIPAVVVPAEQSDLEHTRNWQTQWISQEAQEMPNKVALKREDDGELLGLMSYTLDADNFAVEIVYLESADHSNANLLSMVQGKKKYVGIAKALFAYAAYLSNQAGYGGVLFFKAKTSKLREYYMREFGAMPLGHYDPFRLIIWEDAAEKLMAIYCQEGAST